MSKVYKAEQIQKPLENYRDIGAFKIYVSDWGLLSTKNFGFEDNKKIVPLYAAFCI